MNDARNFVRTPRREWGLAASAGVLAVLALSAGCRRDEPLAQPPPPVVTVARPAQHEVIEWDEYTGRLEAVDTVDLRARVNGLVVSAPFREGSVVRRGDVLVEIDVRPYQAELDARIADEAQAAAKVRIAQIEFDRIDRVPPEARTATEYDTAAAALQEAQAARAAAQAAVESARLNVEWCHVTAPISGRISNKFVTPGNLITGGTGTGTLLTTITSIDPVYCYLDLDERSVLKYQQLAREGKRPRVREAQVPVQMQLANESGFPHEGVIDFVDNRVDPSTGTIRARGVFANSDGSLTPGLFARVRVPGSGRYDALLVPDAAVTTNQNERLLMVVGADDTVQPRPVRLGALFADLRAISSGIGPDDRVVINGQLRIRPGMKVAPREEQVSVAALTPLPARFGGNAASAAKASSARLRGPGTGRSSPALGFGPAALARPPAPARGGKLP